MTVEINALKHREQRCHRPPMRSLARQRGALGIFGAAVLLLSVLFTAVAVDTGRLMLEKRRLQSVADMAALDASSQSGHCGDGKLSTAQAAAEASAARNGHPVGGTRTLDVALGGTSTEDGVRVFAAGDPETAKAVEVIAGNTVPASLFAGGMFGEQVTLQAGAVAKREMQAGFAGGSGLASLDSKKSDILNLLLGEILGSTVNLAGVSYQGIAKTDVTLLELIEVAEEIGTVYELLDAGLSVGDLLQIYADAVNAKEVVNAEVIAAMQTLINANVSDLSVKLGDILAVAAPDVEAAASAPLNLLNLITTTALVANGENALELPLSVDLPGGLLNVTTNLEVIRRPEIAIGPPGKDENDNWYTEMKTAQVRLNTTVKSDINLVLAQAEVDLALRVEVAQGSAWLKSIQCRNQENDKSIVTIGAQPGIASVALGATDPDASAAAIRVKLLGIPIADVAAGLNVELADPVGTELEYEVGADEEWPMVQRASSSVGGSLSNGLSGLADSLKVEVTLLTISVVNLLNTLLNVIIPGENDILGAVLGNLLVPLLTQLSTTILDPLLQVLGIEVGYLDVQLFKLDIDSQRPELLI